jgi:hypothetical protein
MSTFFQIFLEKFDEFSIDNDFLLDAVYPGRQEFAGISLNLSLLSVFFAKYR